MGWPILVTSCALWLAMRTKKKATPSSTSSKELSSLHCKWICCCSVFISSSPQNFLTISILSCRLVQCYPIVVQIHDHSFPPLSLRFLLFHVPSENPIIKGVNANESVTVWVASQSYMDSMVLSMAQWRPQWDVHIPSLPPSCLQLLTVRTLLAEENGALQLCIGSSN